MEGRFLQFIIYEFNDFCLREISKKNFNFTKKRIEKKKNSGLVQEK